MAVAQKTLRASEIKDEVLPRLIFNMNFLIDECVHHFDIESILILNGHSVTRLPSQTSDDVIYKYAKEHKCIIITWDRDFLNKDKHPLTSNHGVVNLRNNKNSLKITFRFIYALLHFAENFRLMGKIRVIRMKCDNDKLIEIVPPNSPKTISIHHGYKHLANYQVCYNDDLVYLN